ncbi:thaumatin [Mycena crocata]|nr:thaumatin [Mycena crocata]
MVSSVIAQAPPRFITVFNNCPFTIWPALYTSSGMRPNQTTGWEAPSFTDVSVTVPHNWNGRIWARRNCDFAGHRDPNSCLDGGCNGGLGVPPATLATFNFVSGTDLTSVSLVDGWNLPLTIRNNVNCGEASCPVDLGPSCPTDLRGPFDPQTGIVIGCKSACNSANCCSVNECSSSYLRLSPATCPSSGVNHYSYFKGNCPNAYAYAFDESSGTAVFKCPDSLAARYTVTFCP